MPEFASRIGVPADELRAYLDATTSPSASLMIRMRRLSDRFAKARSHQPPQEPPRRARAAAASQLLMIGRSDDLTLRRILAETRTIAVVGASQNPARPSHEIYSYLLSTGQYQVYPVNPTITEIDGAQVYPRLADLPVAPDMVDVFRRFDELPSVLAETLALKQRPKTLWLQQGLWHEQVGRDAEAAGMQVVMDRCLMVDHARLR